MKITLQDIIDRIAEQNGVTKKLSEDFLRELLAIVEETLSKGDVVKIKGFGTFKLLPVEERKSVNVQTGEEMTIPAHNKISFTPEKELKAAINKPYSHLETYILSQDGPVDNMPEEENEEEENEEEQPVAVVEADEQIVIVEKEQQTIIIIKEKEEVMSIEKEEEQLQPQPEVAKEKIEKKTLSEIIERGEEPLPEVIEKNEPHPVDPGKIQTENTGKKKKYNSKWGILLIILGLIALLVWLWWDYSPQRIHVKDRTETAVNLDNDELDEEEEPFSNVGIIDETAENAYVYKEQEDVDSITPNPNRAPEFPGEYMFDEKFDFRLLDFMQSSYPNMKLITYGTPRKVELKAGRRLTLVALEYYGHKQFWVYIYFYNTDIIKDPNNIPAGTVIKVPRLDKSLADPNNQATIDVAREIQRDLLNL